MCIGQLTATVAFYNFYLVLGTLVANYYWRRWDRTACKCNKNRFIVEFLVQFYNWNTFSNSLWLWFDRLCLQNQRRQSICRVMYTLSLRIHFNYISRSVQVKFYITYLTKVPKFNYRNLSEFLQYYKHVCLMWNIWKIHE